MHQPCICVPIYTYVYINPNDGNLTRVVGKSQILHNRSCKSAANEPQASHNVNMRIYQSF